MVTRELKCLRLQVIKSLSERILYIDTQLVSMKCSGIFCTLSSNQYACFSR